MPEVEICLYMFEDVVEVGIACGTMDQVGVVNSTFNPNTNIMYCQFKKNPWGSFGLVCYNEGV